MALGLPIEASVGFSPNGGNNKAIVYLYCTSITDSFFDRCSFSGNIYIILANMYYC